MYLYKNWIRYACTMAPSTDSRRENVYKILTVMNDLCIPWDVVKSILPLQFIRTDKRYAWFVSSDEWPNLEAIFWASSPRIFKDAMRFMNQCKWVYSYEHSYTDMIARNLEIDIPISVWERKMILVPDIFTDLILKTFVSEEKCQEI